MNNIKISIIVPIHNAGHRLNECLETLINQTLREIEIICILDKPTDGSDKVAEEFAGKDNRVKLVYNETNIQLSACRNKGIENAIGEYIGFSDHDDTRALNMYEELYKVGFENNSEIVFSDSVIINNTTQKLITYKNPTKKGIISSLLLPMENKENENYLSRSVWGSIYKNSFIKSNNISFLDRRIYFEEDTLFNLKAFTTTTRINYCKNAYYNWHQHNESESNAIITHIENVDRQLNFLDQICFILKSYNILILHKRELWILISDLLNTYFSIYKSLADNKEKLFISILQISSFPIWGRYSQLKLFSKKRIRLLFYMIQIKFKQIKSK